MLTRSRRSQNGGPPFSATPKAPPRSASADQLPLAHPPSSSSLLPLNSNPAEDVDMDDLDVDSGDEASPGREYDTDYSPKISSSRLHHSHPHPYSRDGHGLGYHHLRKMSSGTLASASAGAGGGATSGLDSDASGASPTSSSSRFLPPPSSPSSHNRHRSGSGSSAAAAAATSSKRKRSRVSPAQLAHLEKAFAQERSPNASKRKEIADVLGMNERQTQVWFQNRRAKQKLLDARARAAVAAGNSGHEPGQASSSSVGGSHGGRGHRSGSSSGGSQDLGYVGINDVDALNRIHEDHEVNIIPCSDLSIGSFRRVSAGLHDLIGYTSQRKRFIAWYIYSAGTGFKMEIPFETILRAELAEDATAGQSRATIHLSAVPIFYRELPLAALFPASPEGARQWQVCDDWTEKQQASVAVSHLVVGSTIGLERVLAPFMASESKAPPAPASTSASASSSQTQVASYPTPLSLSRTSSHSALPTSIQTPSIMGVVPSPLSAGLAMAPPSSYRDPFSGRPQAPSRRRSGSGSTQASTSSAEQPGPSSTSGFSASMTDLSSGTSPSTFASQQQMPYSHPSASVSEVNLHSSYGFTFGGSESLKLVPQDDGLPDGSMVPISKTYARSTSSASSGQGAGFSRPGTSLSFHGAPGGQTNHSSDEAHLYSTMPSFLPPSMEARPGMLQTPPSSAYFSEQGSFYSPSMPPPLTHSHSSSLSSHQLQIQTQQLFEMQTGDGNNVGLHSTTSMSATISPSTAYESASVFNSFPFGLDSSSGGFHGQQDYFSSSMTMDLVHSPNTPASAYSPSKASQPFPYLSTPPVDSEEPKSHSAPLSSTSRAHSLSISSDPSSFSQFTPGS